MNTKPFYLFCQQDLKIDNINEHLKNMYKSGMSCNHIAEYFKTNHNISISPKGVEYYLKNNYTYNKEGKLIPGKDFSMRTLNKAKRLAIKSGRMIYRKTPKQRHSQKGISASTRLQLLTDNDFKCSICGNGRHNGYSLNIHDNKVLCSLCLNGMVIEG
jgi:predicted methyltransferase